MVYAFDGGGNTSQRLDVNGTVLETLLCSAWGSLQSTNPSSDPYRGFGSQAGVQLDSSGLYYLPDGTYYDADDGDPANTYIPSSGLDEIHHAGGGRRGGAMARGFFNSALEAIPGGGLVPALTGRDTFGCEVDGWGRALSGVNGVLSLLGVAGHFAGPATEAAAGAAVAEEGTFTIYRSPRPNQLPGLHASGEMTWDLTQPLSHQNLHVSPDVAYADWYNQQYGTGIWKTTVPASEYKLAEQLGLTWFDPLRGGGGTVVQIPRGLAKRFPNFTTGWIPHL